MQPPNSTPDGYMIDFNEEEFQFQDNGSNYMLTIPPHFQQGQPSSSYIPEDTLQDTSTTMHIEPTLDPILDLDAALVNPNLHPDDSQTDLMTLEDDVSRMFERDKDFENYNDVTADVPTSNPIATGSVPLQLGQRLTFLPPTEVNPRIPSVVNISTGEESYNNIQITTHRILGRRRGSDISPEARKERPYACVICFTNRHFELCQPPHLIDGFRSVCRECLCTYDLRTGKGNRKGVHAVTGIAVARPGDTMTAWIDHACAGTVTFSNGAVRTGFAINHWDLDACKSCGHKPGINRDNDATPVCLKD